MKKKLPKFKTEEEVRFWDTHSLLDYPDEFVDVKEPFEFAPSLLRRVTKRKKEKAFTEAEYAKLGALSKKEKGKEKPVTKKFIENLK